MQKKYCPVMGHGPGGLTHCKREQCAWWDKQWECCIVVSLLVTKKIAGSLGGETGRL